MNYQSITITAPGKAELVSRECVEPLMPNQVRGRTLFSLISPGTELAMNFRGSNFPNFPGYSSVFQVEETGLAVAHVKRGDLLFAMTGHQSMQQIPVDQALPVSVGLSPDHATIARLMGVSMSTLMTTKARPGDRVLVTGLGPVGYCAACVFAASGYEVHGVEPSDARRLLLPSQVFAGLHSAAPLGNPSLRGTVALVVECSGHEQAVIDGCAMTRKGGEVVLVGVPWKPRSSLQAHDLLRAVFHSYVHLRSGWEWELPVHSSDFRDHSIFSGLRLALQWLNTGKVPLDGLVARIDPRDAQAAYAGCESGAQTALFHVFDWSGLGRGTAH